MGREIRMVPPNWVHPKNEHGQDQPMRERRFEDEFAKWLEDFDRIRSGNLKYIERECYLGKGKIPLAEWLHDDGRPPDPKFYRPWSDGEATWFQVWQTVSERTPVSPPFATREELIDYLVINGDFWDQKRGDGGYSRAQAEAFVNAGWAPSMAIIGGQSATGIGAASLISSTKEKS